jgi:DNA-binding LacI/PurR family transcriptional regulator
MERNKPIQSKAEAYIKNYIENEISDGEKLTSLRELAQRTGVSVFTVSTIIKKLTRENKVYTIHGHGIYKGSNSTTPLKQPADVVGSKKWNRLSSKITDDIFKGRFDEREISLKEIGTFYNVSFTTAKKVLLHLTKKGLLVETGKGYRIRSFATKKLTSSIVLIISGNADGVPQLLNERDYELLKVMESECHYSNIKLVIHTHCDGKPFLKSAIDAICSRHLVIGFIVVGSLIKDYNDVTRAVTSYKLPVSIFAERERDTCIDTISDKTAVFSIEYNEVPGKIMGNHLINCGHKKILYFDAHPDDLWSKKRFKGLKDTVEFTDNNISLIHIPMADKWQAFLSNNDIITFLHKKIPSVNNNLHATFVRNIASLESVLNWDIVVYNYFIKLFGEFIKDPLATAWVGNNDTTALIILDYLKTNRIDVPRKISVCGFDNIIGAQKSGLTSYDFNVTAVARSMVRYVISPNDTPGVYRRTVEGYLHARSSSTEFFKRA